MLQGRRALRAAAAAARGVRGERLQPQPLEAEHPVPRADLVGRPRAAALDAGRPPAVRDEARALVAPEGKEASSVGALDWRDAALPVAPPARVDLGEVVGRDLLVEVVAAAVVRLLRVLRHRPPLQLVLRLLPLVVVMQRLEGGHLARGAPVVAARLERQVFRAATAPRPAASPSDTNCRHSCRRRRCRDDHGASAAAAAAPGRRGRRGGHSDSAAAADDGGGKSSLISSALPPKAACSVRPKEYAQCGQGFDTERQLR